MKHLVNVSLLLFFLTLLTSGVMRFVQPFSLTVTRVHIGFGLGVAVLVGFHLSSRGKYFRNLLTRPKNPSRPAKSPARYVLGAVLLWAYMLAAALWNLWPIPQLIGCGYEAQHAKEIFRPHRRVAYQPVESGLRLHRGESADTGLRIEFDWGPAFEGNVGELDLNSEQTQLAIWAENEEGLLLETIYVSQTCAGGEEVTWGGQRLRRRDVLPVWCARRASQPEPEPGPDVDAVSSATPVRDFSMDGHLQTGALPFAIYAEVNAANDFNETYRADAPSGGPARAAAGVGQPSVVYEARIYPTDERPYYLMELIGHSGDATDDGQIDYDLGDLTTAKQLIDKILIGVRWPEANETEAPPQ